MGYTVAELEAALAQSYSLAEQCREIIAQQRGIRRDIREQLEQVRHAERVAKASEITKRPRGRPPKPGALTAAERRRRYQLRKQAERMSTPEVQVICVLKKKPLAG